jgi:hypothetical protein
LAPDLGTSVKAGLSDAEAQDVVQDTILTIAKALPEFEYGPARESSKSWLCNTGNYLVSATFLGLWCMLMKFSPS